MLLVLHSKIYCYCVTFSSLFLIFIVDFNTDFEKADFKEDLLLSIITVTIEERKNQSKQACWTDKPGKLYIEKLLNYEH